MKDYLKQFLSGVRNQVLGRCLVREYLQVRLLQSLQDRGVFNTWAFQGGTALRLLYGMPRFSEDLGSALIEPGTADDFRDVVSDAGRFFKAENYDVGLRVSDAKTVKFAFVSFRGLLFELGLSAHASETLSVKVEVDSNPPAGAGLAATIIRRHVILQLRHHDKASLFAGKLHAILARRYTKGRDIYDLLWYLSDRTWPPPNLELLNNALRQTHWPGPPITRENWRPLVSRRLETIRWRQVVEDVRPFLERPEDVALLTKENLLALLQR
jgi:hypothetical protein